MLSFPSNLISDKCEHACLMLTLLFCLLSFLLSFFSLWFAVSADGWITQRMFSTIIYVYLKIGTAILP